jgi:archaetidylinositol phosphate synthase
MNDIRDHKRINDIFFGPLERPALKWLAAHMPAWVSPDICTGLGLAGAVVIFAAYLLSNLHPAWLWLASFGFVLNWFGDSMDGTLARYRHIERPIFGFYVDHYVDAITETLIVLGLGLTPYVSFYVASLTLVAYLLLSILVYVRTSVTGQFQISYGKLGPTEVRVITIILNTAMFFGGRLQFPIRLGSNLEFSIGVYDVLVGYIGFLLVYNFLNTGIQEMKRLSNADRKD